MKCGFYKLDITPPLGCHLAGYPKDRVADKILDPLHLRAVAFQDDLGGTAIFLVFDVEGIPQSHSTGIREYVAEYVGCQRKDVFVSAVHTHTGPNIYSIYLPIDTKFVQELPHYAARAAQGALDDLREASLFHAKSQVPGISFVRRYRMKDGTIKTNPGRHNPNIAGPMNEGDETLQLLRVVREGAGDVLLVNFQVHPDVISGTGISADYPGTVCDTLENALPGVKCIYFNGAAGDLNHVDVNCPEWDTNSGKEHSLHMGRTIAGRVLEIYTKARPIEASAVKTMERETTVKIKRPDAETLTRSEEIMKRYWAGEYGDIMKNGYTTTVMEAQHNLLASQIPEDKTVFVCGASLGDIAFLGMPGEAFCEIGKQLRADSPFAAQFILGQTNGMEGYFPTAAAFGVNGYEARTSMFQPDVAQRLTDAGNKVTKTLFEP